MRVFRCPTCGHRMRFVGQRCGRCYSEKPIALSGRLYLLLLYLLIMVGCLVLVVRTLARVL